MRNANEYKVPYLANLLVPIINNSAFKKGWVVAMLYTLSAMLLSASLKEGIQLI